MVNKYLNRLQGQLVVCIGGTRGIGYGTAEACIEQGAAVTVASSKQENVDRAVKLLKESYPEAHGKISGHIVDLASASVEGSLKTLFDFATENGSHKIDHIIDTSGDGVPRLRLEEATSESLEQALRVRYFGAILMAKVAQKYLKPAYTSSITLTSGVMVYRPPKGMGLITAGAKDGITRGLAVELAPIRVNLVNPGAIDTELLQEHGDRTGDREGMYKQWASRSLLERVGTVEDIVEIYLGLVKSGFVTGSVVHAEGGYLLK